MRTKRRALLVAVVVAAAIFLAWLALRPRVREPEYQGKKLSYWLDKYDGNMDEREGAERAVRAIGTNAIPTLLRMLEEKDSRARTKVFELFVQLKFIGNPIVPATVRNYWAASGFEILGAEAEGAVPRLIEILEHDPSESIREHTADALGGIGPAARLAIPALINGVTNTNSPPNVAAVMALGQIHAEPEIVVPVLMQWMTNPNQVISLRSIRAIGEYGPEAQQAIPTLIAEATNPASRLRYQAIWNLGQIHAQRELVLPLLMDFLTNGNVKVRQAASNALALMGEDAKPAIPKLLELTAYEDLDTQIAALRAVVKIDLHSEAVVRTLGQCLSSTDFFIRRSSAEWLLEAGTFAQPAKPDLLRALDGKDERVRALAQSALKKIDPEAAAKAGVK